MAKKTAAKKKTTKKAAPRKRSKRSPARQSLVLEGKISVAESKDLADRFTKSLAKKGPIVLDTEQVTQVDTAAMQVLVAMQNTAAAQDRELTWNTPSAAITDAATVLGLQRLLNSPDDTAEPEDADDGLLPVF